MTCPKSKLQGYNFLLDLSWCLSGKDLATQYRLGPIGKGGKAGRTILLSEARVDWHITAQVEQKWVNENHDPANQPMFAVRVGYEPRRRADSSLPPQSEAHPVLRA